VKQAVSECLQCGYCLPSAQTYVRIRSKRTHAGIATDLRRDEDLIRFCSVLLLHSGAVIEEALPESRSIGLRVKGVCSIRLRGITELLESCEQLGSSLRLCGGCGQVGMGSGQQL
jgi:hypothetical protein